MRLGSRLFYTHISAGTIVVTSLYFTEASIRKEELLGLVVDGQSVGREYIRTYDNPHVFACQGGSHDAGPLFVPVGPKHQAEKNKKTKSN